MFVIIHFQTSTCYHLIRNTVASNTSEMKVVIVFALCLAYVLAAPTLETCKCWDEYTAKADADGAVSCRGNHVFAMKPCNLPRPPKCVCKVDKPTSILTDEDGTWCAISEAGKVVKKWPCENVDAWAAYNVEFEEFERQRKADD